MRKANGSDRALRQLLAGAFLFFCTGASADQPNLTKMVAGVAAESWPSGKVPAGSGFFVNPHGEILTAAHVVAGCRHITVRLSHSRKFDATLIGVDTRLDVALLQTAAKPHSFVKFADAGPLQSAPMTIVMRSAVTTHILHVPGRFLGKDEQGLMMIAAALSPGASGAAVIDRRGNVVAYVIGRMRDQPGVALAVSAGSLRELLRYFATGSVALRSEAGAARSAAPDLRPGDMDFAQPDASVAVVECLS